jgi:hypothetical protein
MTRDVTPILKAVQTVKTRKPMRRTKAGSAAALKRKATVLHSRYVRARDGRCVRCGRTDGQLQCAHVFSRRYAATRTFEGNAVCLDAACHRYLTENPFEHVVFFQTYLGLEQFEALKVKAYAGIGQTMKADFWEAECARLSAALERLGVS